MLAERGQPRAQRGVLGKPPSRVGQLTRHRITSRPRRLRGGECRGVQDMAERGDPGLPLAHLSDAVGIARQESRQHVMPVLQGGRLPNLEAAGQGVVQSGSVVVEGEPAQHPGRSPFASQTCLQDLGIALDHARRRTLRRFHRALRQGPFKRGAPPQPRPRP